MDTVSSKDRFLELYDTYGDRIFRFCLSKTNNRETALDLTQDTFLKVWDYIASGQTVENMSAFAFTVARNLITDYYRKKRPRYEHELSEELADVIDEESGPADTAEAKRLLALLGELPDEYREVLVLRFVEGYAVKDIAVILGERENTVSVRINRALKALRGFFEEGVPDREK